MADDPILKRTGRERKVCRRNFRQTIAVRGRKRSLTLATILIMAEVIHDRFKLLKKCGSGGTGEVFQARDLRLKRLVAIKRVQLGNRDLLDRLLKEAVYLATVEHPNVVVVHDILETDSSVAIIMELVKGTPFVKLFRKKPLIQRDFIGYFLQLVAALEAVHGVGLIHRDVNPRNVLVSREGVIKLTDFGLSAPVEDENPRAGGTLGYMAPETLRKGGRISFGVDIYSLGFMAYQALLGITEFKKLYGSKKPRDWVRWVLSRERFKTLEELGVPVDPEFSNLVRKMLEKEPDRRHKSIIDVRQELDRFSLAAPSQPEAAGEGRDD